MTTRWNDPLDLVEVRARFVTLIPVNDSATTTRTPWLLSVVCCFNSIEQHSIDD
jgi:hypothetical protein